MVVVTNSRDILPNSRAKESKNILLIDGINYVPVYCANCGKQQGMVPENHISHVFALCDRGCAGKYGDLAHSYVDPDEIFRRQATEEQLTKFGRLLTAEEVTLELEKRESLLAALAKDWQKRMRSTEK
jgi:hypothetical protein